MCTAEPVGAGLPAKRPAHPTSRVTDAPPSLASQRLQGNGGHTHFRVRRETCRSWLASEEAGKSNIRVTDAPPSLASQLLQGNGGHTHFRVRRRTCRSWLASEEADTSNIPGD
ncbi:hypothetical protein EMIT0194P_320037 [Pseudomonas serbica]